MCVLDKHLCPKSFLSPLGLSGNKENNRGTLPHCLFADYHFCLAMRIQVRQVDDSDGKMGTSSTLL